MTRMLFMPPAQVPSGGSHLRLGSCFLLALLVGGWAPEALAQAIELDPAGSNVIAGALGWLQGTLLGTVATVAAVIAIAAVGYMMLTGRLNWHRVGADAGRNRACGKRRQGHLPARDHGVAR